MTQFYNMFNNQINTSQSGLLVPITTNIKN